MSVTISCPRCGVSVKVVRDGYVVAHADPVTGVTCAFERTARSGGPVTVEPLPPEEIERRRALLKRTRGTSRDRDKTRSKAEKGKNAQRAESKPSANTLHIACPSCGLRVGAKGSRLYAHKNLEGKWCAGGDSMRTMTGTRRGSVRTLRGGLPGLGKRR